MRSHLSVRVLATAALGSALAACTADEDLVAPATRTASAPEISRSAGDGLNATAPASAAADTRICHLPYYGGDYYCAYGSRVYPLSRETQQVFVIGLDHAVWTRWSTNGKRSDWVSLHGEIQHTYRASDFQLHSCRGNPYVMVRGLDGRFWINYRQPNGVWTGWAPGNGVAC